MDKDHGKSKVLKTSCPECRIPLIVSFQLKSIHEQEDKKDDFHDNSNVLRVSCPNCNKILLIPVKVKTGSFSVSDGGGGGGFFSVGGTNIKLK